LVEFWSSSLGYGKREVSRADLAGPSLLTYCPLQSLRAAIPQRER